MVDGLAQGPELHPLDVIVEPPLRLEPETDDRPVRDWVGRYVRDMRQPVAVRYVGFRCFRESTEVSESEEPSFVFGVLPTDVEKCGAVRTQIYDDVDRNESRADTIEIYRGPPAGLAFSLTVVEHDTGDPEKHLKIVENAVDKASDGVVEGLAQIPVVGPAVAVLGTLVFTVVAPAISEAINDALDTDDDVVGSAVISLTPRDLIRMR